MDGLLEVSPANRSKALPREGVRGRVAQGTLRTAMPTGTVRYYGSVVVGDQAKGGRRGAGHVLQYRGPTGTKQRTPETAQNKANTISFHRRRARVAPKTSRRNAIALSPRGIWCTDVSFEPLLGTPRRPELAPG